MLREDVGIDPVYRERFRREGALLAALDHPHIIPIYGMGEIDGELYIATRLVSGTLRNLILAGADLGRRRDDDPHRVAERARRRPRAPASSTATSSPPTCWSTPAREVYLGDFGLARDPDGAALTVPGQVLGTIDYMAPELLDGERVGPQTDIYALRLPGGRDADR